MKEAARHTTTQLRWAASVANGKLVRKVLSGHRRPEFIFGLAKEETRLLERINQNEFAISPHQ
jgi:hypothetical protein